MGGHNTIIFASFDTANFEDPESANINFVNDSDYSIINPVPATLNYAVSSFELSSLATPTLEFTSNGIDGFGNNITTFQIPKINFAGQKIYFIAKFKASIIPFKREPQIENSVEFLTTYNGDTLRIFNTNDESLLIEEKNLQFSLISGYNPALSSTNIGSFSVSGASETTYNTIYFKSTSNNRWVSNIDNYFFQQSNGIWGFTYGGVNTVIAAASSNLPSTADWSDSFIGAQNWQFNNTNVSVGSGSNITTAVTLTSVKFESTTNDLTGTAGGFFKGFLTSTLTGTDLRIRIVYNTTSYTTPFTAYSTPFDIYPKEGIYDVRKINEDNDQTQAYKDLIFQDVLLNKNFFFNNLLGKSVGNKNSSTDTLGIKIHEKTSNFVSNIADIDYCNLKALISMFKSLDINFEEYNQQFPPSLTRLIDILSVSPSRQIKKVNQYQDNYNDNGFTSKTVFGKNKGAYLPIESTVLYTGSSSKYILAYERFSENFSLVNTNILSATDIEYKTNNSYALSSYNNSWGWGLVIPAGLSGIGISDFYDFFDYDNTIEGSLIEDFIDYANDNCTYLQNISSFGQIMDKNGVADSLLQHNLYSNCGLISGIGANLSGASITLNVDAGSNIIPGTGSSSTGGGGISYGGGSSSGY